MIPDLIMSRSPRVQLHSLLGISSLLCTAYYLHLSPISSTLRTQISTRTLGQPGPLQRHLKSLITGLNIAVILDIYVFQGRRDAPDGLWRFAILPSGESIQNRQD